jgi:predicted peptidase
MSTAITSGGRFESRTVKVDGVSHRYQVYVPAGYDAVRKWPAILFLHGSGERGDEGEKQVSIGLGKAIRDGAVEVAAIVVFPQCPTDDYWVGHARRIALAALDETEREFNIDGRRISLTGMSMGGAGVWIIAAEHPDRFAAIAPVCGYVRKPPQLSEPRLPPEWLTGAPDPYAAIVSRLPRVPIWIFHGDDDPVVPLTESRHMADLLGGNAAYTEFPHVGHDAWDPAYRQTGLVGWLVKQHR